jgi:hypothetical protein
MYTPCSSIFNGFQMPNVKKPWFDDGNTQGNCLSRFGFDGLSLPVFPVKISSGIKLEASCGPKTPGKFVLQLEDLEVG